MDYEKKSDLELRRLIMEGDRQAEACLTARYADLVEACAHRFYLIGGEQTDLIQEGMIGLVSAAREYKPESGTPFRVYAGHCIRTRLFSAIRAASRLKHRPLNQSVSLEQLSEDPSESSVILGPSPEELVLARESKEELYSVISRSLSALENSVFQCYMEGLSVKETALRLGKSEKSVDNALQRVRRKLARDPKFGDISES